MANFKVLGPFNVPANLLVPQTSIIKGVLKKTYPETSKDNLIYISFKSYGGTQKTGSVDGESNNILVVEDTSIIETWYNPNITSDCIFVLDDGTKWECLGNPEDVSRRHQWMRIKVRSIGR